MTLKGVPEVIMMISWSLFDSVSRVMYMPTASHYVTFVR